MVVGVEEGERLLLEKEEASVDELEELGEIIQLMRRLACQGQDAGHGVPT